MPPPSSHFLKICKWPWPIQTPNTPRTKSHVPFPLLSRTKVLVLARGVCSCFMKGQFLRWGVVSTSPNLKVKYHPLSAVRDCLFNIFAYTLHIGGRSAGAPCRGDRDPLIMPRKYLRADNSYHWHYISTERQTAVSAYKPDMSNSVCEDVRMEVG